MHQPPPYGHNQVVTQQAYTEEPRKCLGGSLGIGIAILLAGVLLIIGYSVISSLPYNVNTVFIAVLILGILYVLAGSLGIAYGATGQRGVAIAFLVFSIISLIASAIIVGFSFVSLLVIVVSLFLSGGLGILLGLLSLILLVGLALSIAAIVISSVVVCCSTPQRTTHVHVHELRPYPEQPTEGQAYPSAPSYGKV